MLKFIKRGAFTLLVLGTLWTGLSFWANGIVTQEAIAQSAGCAVPNPNSIAWTTLTGPLFVGRDTTPSANCSLPAGGLNTAMTTLANAITSLNNSVTTSNTNISTLTTQIGLTIAKTPTNAGLKALALPFFAGEAHREGFTTAGDGGDAFYTFSGSNCAAADNATQVQPNVGTGCWVLIPPPVLSLALYGPAGDGVTDDGAKLQALFNTAGNNSVAIPAKTFRSSVALTIPDYMNVTGQIFEPNTFGLKGSIIQCDATLVSDCITIGNGDNKPASLTNLTISRGSGVVGGGCVTINNSQEVFITRVECYNHVRGFLLNADNAGNGIYYFLNNVDTCRISNTHVVINGVPGVYVDHGVFGCNGTGGLGGDITGTNYVRITGNWDNTKGTIHFIEPHFNTGFAAAPVTCGVNLTSFTGVTNILFDLEFIGGHTEVAQQWLCSDSTVKGIDYLQVLGMWVGGGWGGANALFSLNSATTPLDWTLSGNHFTGWTTAALAPTGGYDDFKITGTSFANTPLSLTAGSSNSVNLDGNEYQGLTLSGNWQGPGSRVTGLARAGSGTYTYGFTGNLQLDITNQSLNTCNVALAFAAGSGLTQTLNKCVWQINGSYVDVTVNITVTALGTSSGNATLTGLPQPANTTALSLTPCYNASTAGLSSGTVSGFFANPTASTVNLYTQAATSVQPLTVSNFTATSNFSCSLRYPLSS